MSLFPRLEFIEKVRSAAAKKMEAASEALLKAREAGEGPVFSDDQNATLAATCKQKGVDPAEFLAVYTTYVRSAFSPKATGLELVAFVEKAVKECPEPAEIIALYRKKSGRQLSGSRLLTSWKDCIRLCLLSGRKPGLQVSTVSSRSKLTKTL